MKLANLTLAATFLLAIFMQGQKLYHCLSDDSVHFMSSCCEEKVEEESCCHADIKTPEATLKAKCCSEFEIQSISNLNEKHTLRVDSKNSPPMFILSSKHEVIRLKAAPVFNKGPLNGSPPGKEKLYLSNSSFLC